MEWTKIVVHTTPYGAEVVTGVLIANNIAGSEIINPQERVRHLTETARIWDYADENLLHAPSDEVHVVFYVTKDENGDALLSDIRNDLSQLKTDTTEVGEGVDLGTLEVKLESADDETWLHEWKKHFKPLRIGNVVIVPEWETYTPRKGSALSFGEACCEMSSFGSANQEIVFTIDPGSAFGTGQHQTTQLCISALQKYLKRGDTLLDIGCGSGILSIIGLLLGAETVVACDIDPAGAIAATKKNARLNPIDLNRLHIHAGDALSDEDLRTEITRHKYEVIVANIVADVIIDLVPFVCENLKSRGHFIASGIIDNRAEDVIAAFECAQSLEITQKLNLDGWYCIVGQAK